MLDNLNTTFNTYIAISEKIALFGFIILVIEDLINAKEYLDGQLFSWKVLSARKVTYSKLILKNWRVLQILVLIISILTIIDLLPFKIVGYILFTTYMILHQQRNIYGFDGSEQMLQVIFLLLLIYYVNPNSKGILFIVYFGFIFHTFIAYFFSGFNKAKGEMWMNGTALNYIIKTESFGNKVADKILSKHPNISSFLTKSTIIYQILFAFIMLIPNNEIRFLWLGFGMLFHLSIGLTMGLNTFIFSFLANYPILYFFILYGL